MGVSGGESKPDLIVGIDFGQTCTGVAYALTQGSDNIRQIQKWPGAQYRNENKVPTVLVYETGSEEPSYWGFQAEDHQDDVTREWFKTDLNTEQLERRKQSNPEDTTTPADVRRWYKDFLTLLYGHLEQKLAAELPNFGFTQAKIEFLFSVPTTWAPSVVEVFRELICQAGFESAHKPHTVIMGLTEAEAAAVHTWISGAGAFDQGDLLVVCDAGGGTSDLCALEVTEATAASVSLRQLKQKLVVDGVDVGSVGIDMAFEKFLLGKFREAQESEPMGIDVETAVWCIQKGHNFQNVKCDFGGRAPTPAFVLPIDGLASEYTHKSTRIAGKQIRVDYAVLRDIFDEQIDRLFALIDKQLIALATKEPDRPIKHLVLSGGLGQSSYVQQRLKDHYCQSERLRNIRDIQVRVAPDPQMAVCKGLVADRLRKLRSGTSVLSSRCCRASYGLVCKMLHNKSKDTLREIAQDPLDGEWYVLNCIDWLIKKGEPISDDTRIRHPFSRMIRRGDEELMFPTRVVVSYVEKDQLPAHLGPDVDQLCKLHSNLSTINQDRFVSKKKKFWQQGQSHLTINYEVRVVVGPADLTFELWFEDEKISDSKAIQVQWTTADDPAPAAESKVVAEEDSRRVQEKPKSEGRSGLLRIGKGKKT